MLLCRGGYATSAQVGAGIGEARESVRQAFDILQAIFWALTYVLIICYGHRCRKSPAIFMPRLAGMLNFAWGISAFVYQWTTLGRLNLACLVWAILDIYVYAYNVRCLKKCSHRLLYVLLLPAFSALLYMMFHRLDTDCFLISAFALDLIMAVEFVTCVKKIAPQGRILIALTKLLGDLFAWLCYMRNSTFVAIVGAVVFLLNTLYLVLCLDETATPPKKNKRKSRTKLK